MDIYPTINADTHEEFLLKLLKELHKDREEKRRLRNLNNAGFLVVKSLEDYDYSEIRFPDNLKLQELEELSFLKKKKLVLTAQWELKDSLGCRSRS